MEPVEYVFSVDVFTPETMPMARLAEYMAALAKLVGHAEHTHFVRLEKGSARIVHKVDAVDVPKVEQRLREVVAGGGPREARKGFEALDELLASDNAVGHFAAREGGGVIIPFPGRDRPRQIVFPSFWQDGSIDGHLVSVGGRDQTAHAILQDGATVYTGLTMRRPLAVRLAPLLYGPKLRITGRGRWERQPDGEWKLLEFKVDRHEILDQRPLGEMLAAVRAVPDNGLMDADAYEAVRDIQSDDGAIH